MTVYSPSQTMEWMRCPMMRALRKEGWISKWGAKKDLAAIIGSSFAAGIGVYNNIRKSAQDGNTALPARTIEARASIAASCVDVAKAVMHQKLEMLEKIGLILGGSDDDEIYLQAMSKRIVNAVTNYVVSDPLPDTFKIVDVELNLGPEAGNARPDLVVRDNLGLAMVDYKTKVQLLARYEAKTKMEYGNTHQMLHYGHFGERHYGEPFGRYYIGLVVFEPRFHTEFVPYPYNTEVLATWARTSQSAWAIMEKEDKGEQVPWMSANHSDNFGQCPYYKACFTHHYDPELMKSDYVLVERVPEEPAAAEA